MRTLKGDMLRDLIALLREDALTISGSFERRSLAEVPILTTGHPT